MTGHRIDNRLTEAVKTGGLTVLTRPATAARMLEHLRDAGPGGIVLLLAKNGSLGASLEESLTGQGLKARVARTEEAAAVPAAQA